VQQTIAGTGFVYKVADDIIQAGYGIGILPGIFLEFGYSVLACSLQAIQPV
jgi:hypothetical protein